MQWFRLTLSSLAQVEMLSAMVLAPRDHGSRPMTLTRQLLSLFQFGGGLEAPRLSAGTPLVKEFGE